MKLEALREDLVRSQGFSRVAERVCPLCSADALCVMPLLLVAQQTDGTNVVCHPLLGGCNHGFEASLERHDDDSGNDPTSGGATQI